MLFFRIDNLLNSKEHLFNQIPIRKKEKEKNKK
jgi:hypothetical protein